MSEARVLPFPVRVEPEGPRPVEDVPEWTWTPLDFAQGLTLTPEQTQAWVEACVPADAIRWGLR